MVDLPILLQVHLFDAASLLHSFGPWLLAGVAVVIFIESGVLFPFLPGDSRVGTERSVSFVRALISSKTCSVSTERCSVFAFVYAFSACRCARTSADDSDAACSSPVPAS